MALSIRWRKLEDQCTFVKIFSKQINVVYTLASFKAKLSALGCIRIGQLFSTPLYHTINVTLP